MLKSMKIMKKIINILSVLLLCGACTKYEAPTFNTESIGFKSNLRSSYSYFEGTDNTPQPSNIAVNIFGQAPTRDIEYSFEIDPASTAQEGTHYNIVGTGSVAANATTGFLPIEILVHNFEFVEPLTLIVRLTNNFVEGFEEKTFSLVKLCPSDLNTSTSYTASIIQHPGFGPPATTNTNVTLTRIDGARYGISDVTARFMEALCCPECITENVVVEDICGDLMIVDPNPDGNNCWDWISPAAGSYSLSTGVITLPVLEGAGRLEMVIRLTPN